MKWDFYFITDRGLSVNGVFRDVEDALRAGCRVIQYREKRLPTRVMVEEGIAIRRLCNEYDALYLVNDRIDLAMATDADGVHLGQSDMPLDIARRLLPGAVIGVSATCFEEGVEAFIGGADYLGVGPIYATSTKPDAAAPTGPDLLTALKEEVEIPLVAIGGITHDLVQEVVRAGADGVAAISATVGANVYDEVRSFLREVGEAKVKRRD